MPLIKPRTRGKAFTRLTTRLEHETNETLYAYAQFLGEPIEYVLNQVIDTVLAKDKEFVTWRTEHPQSCVPRARPKRVRKGPGTGTTAHESASAGPTRRTAVSA